MTVSVRSFLTVGMAALTAGAVAVAPVHTPAPEALTTATVRLSAAVQPLLQPVTAAAAVLGQVSAPAPAPTAAATPTPQASATANNAASNAIINLYNFAEPWVQWGFAVGAWALSYVPIAGYFAQQVNIAYATGEPIVGSWVYSLAALLDGQIGQIPQILVAGVQQAVNNFIQGEIQWISGYLPPLPPFPPLAATAPSKVAAAAAATVEAVQAPAARNVNPARAARAGVAGVARAAAAVAPAADAVESTPTESPKTAVKSVTSAVQDAVTEVKDTVKDTVNSVRDSAKKTRSSAASGAASGAASSRDHTDRSRSSHGSAG